MGDVYQQSARDSRRSLVVDAVHRAQVELAENEIEAVAAILLEPKVVRAAQALVDEGDFPTFTPPQRGALGRAR